MPAVRYLLRRPDTIVPFARSMIAQRPATTRNTHTPATIAKQFFDQTFRCGTRHNGKSHRAQEKRQCLRLKSRFCGTRVSPKQRPFQPNHPPKTPIHLRGIAAPITARNAVSSWNTVKKQQRHHARHCAHPAAPCRPECAPAPFVIGLKRKIYTAIVMTSPNRSAANSTAFPLTNRPDFDRVGDRPAAVVVAR